MTANEPRAVIHGSRRSPSVFSLLIALFALLASGCIDMKADAVVSTDGSGLLSLSYTVPKALESLERYQGSFEALPLPLERASLDRRASNVSGVTLSRWSKEDAGEEIRISSEIRFNNLSSLAQFLDPDGNRIQFETVDGLRELRVFLSSGTPPAPDALSWMDMAYADYRIELSVTLPSRVVSASPGALSASGRIARFSSPTRELLKLTDPLVWTIRW